MLDDVVPWPPSRAATYRAKGYWRGQPLGEALWRAFRANATRPALVDATRPGPDGAPRRMTYGELALQAERAAHHLVERGLTDGARVVFQLPNVLEFVVLYAACLRVGAIPVTALPAHRASEIEHLVRACDASAWFVAASFRGFSYLDMARELRPKLPSLREIWVLGDAAGIGTASIDELLAAPIEQRGDEVLRAHAPSASDVAVLQLSGGTTALPKLIPRTHDDYLFTSLEFAKVCGEFDRDTVLLVPIPIAHNFPLATPGVQASMLLGACTVLAPTPAPEVVFPLVASERATWVPAVPATAIRWLHDPRRREFDLSSIKTLAIGGHRLNPEPARALVDAFGPVLVQVYGMAEGLLCCTRRGDPAEVVYETQGRPMSPDDELRAVDDEGNQVPAGEIGELETRGPYTTCGYYRAREHNAIAFTADGFYRTGDLVRIRPDGNVVVEGRTKDVINRGGEKVNAEEIENLLLKHPAVHNAAVVGYPDPELGQRVCACVVLHAGATLTLDELRAFLKQAKISAFKLPERLAVYDALPVSAVGKISKKQLRADLGG